MRDRISRGLALGLAVAALASSAMVATAQDDRIRSERGLLIYLGVVPAELIRSRASTGEEREMHGGPPMGRHVHHIMIALFDSRTGERIEHCEVHATLSGVGLAGTEKRLEPMTIAGALTYGNYYQMPAADTYRIRVVVRRPGVAEPVETEFKYDHPLGGH